MRVAVSKNRSPFTLRAEPDACLVTRRTLQKPLKAKTSSNNEYNPAKPMVA